jgi:hypothetical protein
MSGIPDSNPSADEQIDYDVIMLGRQVPVSSAPDRRLRAGRPGGVRAPNERAAPTPSRSAGRQFEDRRRQRVGLLLGDPVAGSRDF